ncbi:NUDIX domain-containing protein [Amycolatopsis keratiniphila]|uniref:NUDIX domain-containing protein n=1 Tax=Amycolatopsis keratiniphila TaxID=129921 RepID=UPI00087C746B|nr:NUDIX hydrolase [Amycolatopsis keratiniphila]OLZ50325.1 NUDIX hydrolase [Amycolatopsis keratiniphila subsp. nogabecina]SDU67349.1 NUDIX domain-containing protein [Amycolatopsis keratiniphila]
MTQRWLPPAEYYATLPKLIGSGGVIYRDTHERALLIETNYKTDENYEIPGGGLNEGESPHACARREAKEELGIDLPIGRLLVTDWVPPQADGRPALTNYVFDGGVLTDEQIATLRPTDGEVKSWTFCTLDTASQYLRPHLSRRLRYCLAAIATGKMYYLENGFAPDTTSDMLHLPAR